MQTNWRNYPDMLQSECLRGASITIVMFISVFIKISLLLHVLISSSHGLNNGRHNFQVQRSKQIPKCTYSEYLYDPLVDSCAEAGTRAHCGENMAVTRTEILGQGKCVCRNELDKPCWGPPQILSRDGTRCWILGERGPCPPGQLLVQFDQSTIQCVTDVCESEESRNAVNYSAVSEIISEAVFTFTYYRKCYKTETEAFCGEGQVARFVYPSNVPSCVPRTQGCVGTFLSSTTNIKVSCDEGFTEDRARNLCVPWIQFDR